ncbi:MAG: transposase [Kiritimatiellae bacterium]|nr:transposase [Kiritimatiellia bacterium]
MNTPPSCSLPDFHSPHSPPHIPHLIRYFDASEPVANLSGNLPHWRQANTTYFVTFRLADSLPQEKLRAWVQEREEWLAAHPEPHDEQTRLEYYELFPERFQRWLDAGYGACALAEPRVKALVERALLHFDGERYRLLEAAVMPNHVHVLVTPRGDHWLSEILHSWKSYSSHQMNRVRGTQGENWQKESFDHIVRNPNQLERIREYIRDNPKRRSGVSPLRAAGDGG